MHKSFKQFLKENDGDYFSTEDIVKTIRDNCKQFLKQSGGQYLYRGMHGDIKPFSELTTNRQRKPKNMDTESHNIFDAAMGKVFGIKGRSATLFCTGESSFARHFGTVFYIFPKDGYRFLWSPKVEDLYIDIQNPLNILTDRRGIVGYSVSGGAYIKEFSNAVGTDFYKMVKDDEGKFIEEMGNLYNSNKELYMKGYSAVIELFIHKEYMDTGLKDAIDSGKEIMVDCDTYYALKVDGSGDAIGKIYGDNHNET